MAAYGYHWVTVGRFIENTDDAYVGGDITVIAPKVAGFIEKVAVTDNQRVEAGELLVKLDDRDYRAALNRAEAAADAQRATLLSFGLIWSSVNLLSRIAIGLTSAYLPRAGEASHQHTQRRATHEVSVRAE